MNEIHAIFYDLDNTLYAQIMDVEQRINYCIKKFPFPDAESIKRFWKKEWLKNAHKKNELIDSIIEKFSLNLNKEEVIYAYRTCRTNLFLAEEIVALLKRIRNQEIKQFVITNGNSLIQSNKIDSLQLNRYFDEIIIAIDEYAKPSVYWFNELISTYKLKPKECISVGDRYAIDGLASQSAEIAFIYKDGGLIKESVPDHIKRIRDLTEIEEYICYEKDKNPDSGSSSR